jgi:hypothetical protein
MRLVIPRRQFLGTHEQLEAGITTALERELKKIKL